jgi:hypothetical protein
VLELEREPLQATRRHGHGELLRPRLGDVARRAAAQGALDLR